MSQAGGPNSAGSVNIDFTGTTTGVEQAAKKAEATVQQAAQNMKAQVASVASAAGGPAAAASGGRPYMPGENFGPMASVQFEAEATKVTRSNDSIVQSLHRKSQAIGRVIGLYTRFVGVIGLVVGAGAGIIALLDRMGRKGYDTAAAIKETNKSIEGMFAQFQKGEGSSPEILRENEFADLEVAKQDAIDKISSLRNEARYSEAFEAETKMNEQIAKSTQAIEQRYRLRTSQLVEKIDKDRADKKAKLEYDIAKTVAENESGALQATLDAVAEEQNARATLKDDELAARLMAIDLELQRKLTAIKQEEDEEKAKDKRVAAEKVRLMQDFYRQQREAQAESTRVESFFAGNQGQSFSLANRQRTAIEGQLPSVNYQGAE